MTATSSAVPARIAQLRAAMQAAGVQAVVVPSSDPHVSEYLPPRWKGREWFSGFTGSMGTLAVGLDKAAVFADSRYWSQAERELAGTGVDLVKTAQAAFPPVIDWLAAGLERGSTVAVDGQSLSVATAKQLRAGLSAAGIAVRSDADLLEPAWPGRPGLPDAPVYEHRAPEAS